MILDKQSNIHRYYGLSPQIKEAMHWLSENDITCMEPGLYQIDGERLMVKVQHYHTVPAEERAVEMHSRYIDLQCQVQGAERFGICQQEDLSSRAAYNEERDIEFPDGTCDYFPLTAGDFFLAFPGEAHQTKCFFDGQPTEVYKAIFKLTYVSQEL